MTNTATPKNNPNEDFYQDTSTRMKIVEKELQGVKETLKEYGHELRQIIAIISRTDSQKPFDGFKALSAVRDVVVLAGGVASLSVWLILTLTSTNDQVTELKIQQLSNLHRVEIQAIQRQQDFMMSRFNWNAVPKSTGSAQ